MTGRGRGKEVALQVEVESQEEWEELISKEGLTVIDVYQEWCGPCKAMVSNFKRFKNEIGDELLRFAVAKADSIEALERYRGKCEPCFLFYAGGLLVDVIRGANSPQLQKKMIYQLAYEHKVLEGQAERKEIRDPYLPHREDKHGAKAAVDAGAEESDEDESSDEEEDETRDENGLQFGGENIMFDSLPQKADIKQVYLEKMFTVGIIKPDIYADGKADEIIDKIRESGFDVLEQMERIFAPEEVQELYSSMKEEEDFSEVIKDMCNGPSIILVLSKGQYGEGIIEEWHEFLGPEQVSEANEKAPKSLRAIYCSPSQQPHADGFHGSQSLEAAKRELNLFFPDFVVPKISITHIRPQRKPTTIAIIRPAALESFRAEILEQIAAEHFKIELQREMQMSRIEIEKFYKEHKDEPYFEELLDNMASGPMLVMALSAADNVVEKWRSLLGSKDVEKAAVLEPDSFRGKYAVRGVNVNQFHGSDSEEHAQKEFDYFFPMEQTLLAIKPHAFYNRDAIIHKVSQAGFRIVARREMELPEDKVKAMYKNCILKEFYEDLASSMTKGSTTFLILSKPNAVADFRALSGPTDPEVAKTDAPQSIRALFGKDILRNAVHTPSSLAAAKEEIAIVFGDVEFDDDGSLKKKKRQKKRRRSSEEIIRHPDEDEGLGDDGEKESPRQSQTPRQSQVLSREAHEIGDMETGEENREDLGERSQRDAEEHRHSGEHLDAKEHRSSQGSQQHLDAKEHRGSQGSQQHLEAKEHRGSQGSQQHLEAKEHRGSQGSQQHLEAKEHRGSQGSQQHLEAKEHRGSQGSQQHLDAKEHRDSQGSQQHLEAKEHRGSQGSQQHLDAKEHRGSQGSQQHLDAKEHQGSKGSQEHIDSLEHKSSKEHIDSDGKSEHKEGEHHKGDSEHNIETHSQKDAGEDSK